MAPTRRTALRLGVIRLAGAALLTYAVASTVWILTEAYTHVQFDRTTYPDFDAVVTDRYPQYAGDLLRFQFGATERIHTSWQTAGYWEVPLLLEGNSVGTIIGNRLPMSGWVILWTAILSMGLGLLLAILVGRRRDTAITPPKPSALALLARGVSIVFLASLVRTLVGYSDRLVNVDWATLIVETPPVTAGLGSMPPILTVHGFLIATKWAVLPALVAATAVVPTVYRIGRTATGQHHDGLPARVRMAAGGPRDSPPQRRHTLLIWFLEALPLLVGVTIVASLVAETYFRAANGLSRVIGAALLAGDPAFLAAVAVLILTPILLADLVRELGIYWITGARRRAPDTAALFAIPSATAVIERLRGPANIPGRLRRQVRHPTGGVLSRIRRNPWPAIGWLVAGAALLAMELGAIFNVVTVTVPGVTLPRLPTLISKTTIPDAAHQTPSGEWVGGFLGLSPALAWAARVLIAAAYVTALGVWAWLGVRIARVVYGDGDADLLTGHTRSLPGGNDRLRVGFLVVLIIGSVGVFAPALSTSLADNPSAPFSQQRVTYLNPETGEVREALMVEVVANMDPDGSPGGTVGLMEYDRYGRFHPLGVSLEGLPGKHPSSRNFDVLLNLSMNLQGVVRNVGLTGVVALVLTAVLGAAAIASSWVDRLLSVVSDRAVLLPLFLVGVFTHRVPGTGGTGINGLLVPPPPVENPQTPWFRQPVFEIHHVVLAVLVALVLVRVVRRVAAANDVDDPVTALREAALPVLGHACLALAGVLIFVVTLRLLQFEHPKVAIGFDVRVPLDFLWIDTALWYRHVVPMLVQYSLGIGLALLGDGLRVAARDRADPESLAPTETDAAGGGG
ncbi:MAG: hypothetical protein ABEJ57_00540 [Halobacteriaceae archaeon]